MKMLYYCTQFFFAERGTFKEGDLCLRFPFDGVLLVNGEKSYPLKDGCIDLPREALYEGENYLFLRTAERLFPCETLIKEGNALRPSHLPMEELVLSLLEENLHLTQALRAVTDRITSLEKKTCPRLFSY